MLAVPVVLAVAFATTSSTSAAREKARNYIREQAKEQAAEEKINVGGDVPVMAWTDPSVKPWATVLCLHGLGLHKESFAPLGKKLASLGVQTYAIDIRGFGAWLKTKSLDRVDFNQSLKDVESSLEAIRLAHPDLPIIILGESMGGAIALQATALYPDRIDGLVSCVPSGDRFGQKMTTAKVAINLLRRPDQLMDVGKKLTHQVTEDKQMAQDWSDDRKARLHLTAKELFEFQTFMNQNHARAKQIKNVPTLIVQGDNDRLVKPASTIEIFNNIATTHKDLLLLGNSEHLVFENGQFNDHTVETLTSWIAGACIARHDRSIGPTKDEVEARLSTEQQEKEDEKQRTVLGHLYLGRGYLLMNNHLRAREELKAVLREARGSKLASEADSLLLTLPQNIIAPEVGPKTRASEADLKLISLSGAMANDKPSVLLFCAPWVEACHSLKQSVVEVMAPYLDRLNFVEINADLPDNQTLLKKYGINPLPAILFLNGQNEVVAYILGNNKASLRAALAKIISSEETSNSDK